MSKIRFSDSKKTTTCNLLMKFNLISRLVEDECWEEEAFSQIFKSGENLQEKFIQVMSEKAQTNSEIKEIVDSNEGYWNLKIRLLGSIIGKEWQKMAELVIIHGNISPEELSPTLESIVSRRVEFNPNDGNAVKAFAVLWEEDEDSVRDYISIRTGIKPNEEPVKRYTFHVLNVEGTHH